MSPSNPQRPDAIIIEQVSRPSRAGEDVPLLPSALESVLIPLLKSASLDPENWHTIPSYDLAVRFIAPCLPSRATAFEIRAARDTDSSHRYRYDPQTDTLTCWSHDQMSHPNLSSSPQLPNDPQQLARLITVVLRTRPETIEPSMIARAHPGEFEHLPSPPDAPGYRPLSYALADVIRHITHNWFGGRETTWGRPTRLLYAFLGSFTFFAMQTVVIYVYEQVRETSSTQQPLVDQFFLAPWQIGALMIILSVIFAVISAYIDRQHGPVRLYLGGFLLPYLPWSLTVLVTAAI